MKRRFLVTAGNTREKIDRVRDWGNIFTGNTGFGIAQALTGLGEVELVTSNRDHANQAAAKGIKASTFTSHEELRKRLESLMRARRFDAVFMTAAVADYRPAGAYQIVERRKQADGSELWTVRAAHGEKIPSTFERVAFSGERTEKIVDLFRGDWDYKGLLFKFKLEVGIGGEELIRIGQQSRVASGADYLVANTLDMVEGDRAGAYLISERGHEFVPRADLARRLAAVVESRLV